MTVTEQSQHLALRRIWHNLAPGPWIVVNEHDQTHDESLKAIITATGIYWGDFASALAYRSQLVHAGVMTSKRLPDGSLEYVKADTFPEPEDSLSWVDKENAELRRRAAEERAHLDREWQLRKQAQDMLDAPYKAAEQANFDHRLNQAGLNPQELNTRLAAIEAALEMLTRQLVAQHENGQRPEEVGIHA